MSFSSLFSSLFSLRSAQINTTNQAPSPVEAKIIPFGVSGKRTDKRSYDYSPAVHTYGNIPLSAITQLSSDRIKWAIISYGTWVSLAKAFSSYQKTLGRYAKETDRQAFGHALDDFHAWNSTLEQPLGEEQVEDIVTRLTSPVIVKENDETDKIRAGALGCSVAEVRARRQAKAEKEKALRFDAMKGFLAEIWSGNSLSDDPFLPGNKVMAKAQATLEWMANQDWIEPAEILLATEDMKLLNRFGDIDNYGGHEGSRTIDEMLADEAMMGAGMSSGK